MSLLEYITVFEGKKFKSVKAMTKEFNGLDVDERKVFLKYLDESKYSIVVSISA